MAKSLGSSFSASSDEFEVISPPTSPPVNTTSLQNLCISHTQSQCEIPSYEINSRIGNLLKENLQLKDILKESNTPLYLQHGMLKNKKSAGQDKPELGESRIIMNKLYDENTKLRKKLNTTKKAKIDNKKSSEEYEKKLHLLENENEKLKYVNRKLNDELKSTKDEFDLLIMERKKLNKEKLEILAATAEQKEKIRNLTHELENFKLDQTTAKLNMSNEYSKSTGYPECMRRKCFLENRLAECRDRLRKLSTKDDLLIKDLKVEIQHLNQSLTQEQATESIMSLSGLKKQIENLLSEYKQLLHSCEMNQYEQNNKDGQLVVYKDIQVKGLKEEIDRLTAQIIANEETIASKDSDNNQLREQNTTLNQEIEKISILQAQLEIYQNDFRIERETKEKMSQEKEIAIQQVHQLEIRCEQLIKELEQYRPSRLPQRLDFTQERMITPCKQNTEHRPIVTFQRSRENELSTTISAYTCPKCNMRFAELQPLENHVNYCLDEDPFM